MGLYNWKTDPELKTNLKDTESEKVKDMERFLKAYIQSFNHRVKNNLLTVDKEF